MANEKTLTVFYDGACPLCRREIGFYRQRDGAQQVAWVDVSARRGDDIVPGLTRDAALGRFHVQTRDGQLVSGGAAFAALWTVLPGFRWLGRLGQTRPFDWVLERAYVAFLKFRPYLQNLVTPSPIK